MIDLQADAAAIRTALDTYTADVTTALAQLAAAINDRDAKIAELRAQLVALQPPVDDGRPSGEGWVRAEDLGGGTDLSVLLKALPAGKKLALPAGQFVLGGAMAGGGYRLYARGLAGLGGVPGGTVIVDDATGTTSTMRIDAPPPDFELCGLTFVGSKRSAAAGDYWMGLFLSGAQRPFLHDLTFRGWAKGTGNAPPAETFQLNLFRCSAPVVHDCEFDGRLPDGTRWAASSIGWNRCTDGSTTRRVHAHHGVAGHLTHWACSSDAAHPFLLEDVTADHNGTGSGALAAHGLNFEQNNGAVVINRGRLALDGMYSQAADRSPNSGLHVYLGADKTNSGSEAAAAMSVSITDVESDRGPGGLFSVAVYARRGTAANLQAGTDPTVVRGGVTLAPVNQSQTKSADPAKTYCRVQ